MSNPKPLEGVKVVELATFIAAPCCCRFLADLGAEVTKIEAPKGDQLRFTAVNEGRPYGDAGLSSVIARRATGPTRRSASPEKGAASPRPLRGFGMTGGGDPTNS